MKPTEGGSYRLKDGVLERIVETNETLPAAEAPPPPDAEKPAKSNPKHKVK
jgi:hypothetical protein